MIRKILGWLGAYTTKMNFCDEGDMCGYNDVNSRGVSHDLCLKENPCKFVKKNTVIVFNRPRNWGGG